MLNEVAFFGGQILIEVALGFTNDLVLVEPVRKTLGLDHQVYKLALLCLWREIHGHVFFPIDKEKFSCVERYLAVLTPEVRQYVEFV